MGIAVVVAVVVAVVFIGNDNDDAAFTPLLAEVVVCAFVPEEEEDGEVMENPIRKNAVTLNKIFSSGTDSNVFPSVGKTYAATMLHRSNHKRRCSRTHLTKERRRRRSIVRQSSVL